MDGMLIHFFLVFDRWMTTPMPPLELTDGSVATGCTTPAFLPCAGTCCTALAIRGLPRTVDACTISLGVDGVSSMWTARLTPSTRA
jgi:hypothetical protein